MKNTIQVKGEDFTFEIQTQKEITSIIVNRMEKQLNALVNDNFYHDLYGRITSINMSLYMLERQTPPSAKPQIDLLKAQIEDLSRIIETSMR